MQYPHLNEISRTRQWTEQFMGLDRQPRAEDGTFSAMGNMTGDPWPLLSSRKKRGLVAELSNPQAMMALGKLAWIDGNTLYFDGRATPVNDLSMSADMLPKHLTAMGVYLIIMPDKRYYNTMDPSDRGFIERLWESGERVAFAPITVGSGASREEYVKITCTGIGRGLNIGDGVRISGVQYTGNNAALGQQLAALNGTHMVQSVTDDAIMIAGTAASQYNQTAGAVRVDRRVPQLDYLMECGNCGAAVTANRTGKRSIAFTPAPWAISGIGTNSGARRRTAFAWPWARTGPLPARRRTGGIRIFSKRTACTKSTGTGPAISKRSAWPATA